MIRVSISCCALLCHVLLSSGALSASHTEIRRRFDEAEIDDLDEDEEEIDEEDDNPREMQIEMVRRCQIAQVVLKRRQEEEQM